VRNYIIFKDCCSSSETSSFFLFLAVDDSSLQTIFSRAKRFWVGRLQKSKSSKGKNTHNIGNSISTYPSSPTSAWVDIARELHITGEMF